MDTAPFDEEEVGNCHLGWLSPILPQPKGLVVLQVVQPCQAVLTKIVNTTLEAILVCSRKHDISVLVNTNILGYSIYYFLKPYNLLRVFQF